MIILDDQAHASAELQQLAGVLTQRGYEATVIPPLPTRPSAPLAPPAPTRSAAATAPTGGTAQSLAPIGQALRADLISRGLHALTSTPAASRTGRGGGQEC